jgi:hypothetical protein
MRLSASRSTKFLMQIKRGVDHLAVDGTRRVPRETRRIAAWLAAATSVAATLLFFYAAGFSYTERCGDSCSGFGWSGQRGSVMWSVQFWAVAMPGLLAVALYVWFLARGHPGRASVAFILAFVAFVAWRALPWLTGKHPGHWTFSINDGTGRVIWAILVLMVGGAVASVLLELMDLWPDRTTT